MMATHISFVDSLLDVRSKGADVPVTLTVVERRGIHRPFHGVVLTPENTLLRVSEFNKPLFKGNDVTSDTYQDGNLRALQLFQ
jgi:hypothetical protein